MVWEGWVRSSLTGPYPDRSEGAPSAGKPKTQDQTTCGQVLQITQAGRGFEGQPAAIHKDLVGVIPKPSPKGVAQIPCDGLKRFVRGKRLEQRQRTATS